MRTIVNGLIPRLQSDSRLVFLWEEFNCSMFVRCSGTPESLKGYRLVLVGMIYS